MDVTKRERLEAAGFRVGSAADFLELTREEEMIVELRVALGRELKRRRSEQGLTQAALAGQIGSSQSRVAKMEAGDPSVSIELLLGGLFGTGADYADVAFIIMAQGREAPPEVQAKEVWS